MFEKQLILQLFPLTGRFADCECPPMALPWEDTERASFLRTKTEKCYDL